MHLSVCKCGCMRACVHVWDEAREVMVLDHTGLGKDFGFYPEPDGELEKGFEEKSDLLYLSGCFVEKRLNVGQRWKQGDQLTGH